MNLELFPSLPTTEKKIRKKTVRKPSNFQKIILKHVAGMEGCKDSSLWGKEGKLCSRLIKMYGSEFLLWVEPPEGHKVQSLTYYFAVPFKYHLSDQFFQFKQEKSFKPPEVSEFNPTSPNIGKDIEVPINKPKTLREFLNYGKNIAAKQRQDSTSATTGKDESISSNGGLPSKE
jgi:hypothetical protein